MNSSAPVPNPANATAVSGENPRKKRKIEEVAKSPFLAELEKQKAILRKFGAKPKQKPHAKKAAAEEAPAEGDDAESKPVLTKEDLPLELQETIDMQKRKKLSEIEKEAYSYSKQNKIAKDSHVQPKQAIWRLWNGVRKEELKRVRKQSAEDFIRPNIPAWLAK
jgi:hypothetical protein